MPNEDILLTEEELQRREFLKYRERQRAEDMAAVISKPAGARFITRLLRDLGVASVGISDADLPLLKFGLRLLNDAKAANPGAWENILKGAFGGTEEGE